MGVDAMGWARKGTMNYLFNGEPDVNEEIAWMFLMCHAQEETSNDNTGDNTGTKPNDKPTKPDPIEDNKDTPIEIASTLEFEAEVKANHVVYFDVYRVNDTILTIKSKDAYVIYNNKTYEAVNGVVSVPNLYSQYTNMPVKIAIGNSGTKDATFDVVLSYPSGHLMNPKNLSMGSFKVSVKQNDEQGVYYTYSAGKAGILTMNVDKVSSKSGTIKAGIVITVTPKNSDIPVQYTLEEGQTTLSIEVKAGDSVSINIGTLPNEQNRYMAADIEVTASFA